MPSYVETVLGKLDPCSESANVCLCQAPCDAIDHLGRHQVARHECVNDARELFEVREFELHNLFQELLSEPAVLTMALSESIQLMEQGHQDRAGTGAPSARMRRSMPRNA